MSKTIIKNPNAFKNMIGNFLGYSQWKLVTQKEIDTFAEATEDYQWIHVDTAKSIKISPYKNTIAHGYYSLSLIPKFVYEVWECKELKLILNYGTEKIRFISPVICNSYIRAAISVINAKEYKGGILLTSKVNIEIKNKDKLALSAETLSLLFS
jgi:acyl dehydratase